MGLTKETIVTRDKNTLLIMYKSMVRPQLEFCIHVSYPYLKHDIELLENGQMRIMRVISGYEDLSYIKKNVEKVWAESNGQKEERKPN